MLVSAWFPPQKANGTFELYFGILMKNKLGGKHSFMILTGFVQ